MQRFDEGFHCGRFLMTYTIAQNPDSKRIFFRTTKPNRQANINDGYTDLRKGRWHINKYNDNQHMEYSKLSCQKTTLEQQAKNKNRARVNLKNKNSHFNSNVSLWQQGKTDLQRGTSLCSAVLLEQHTSLKGLHARKPLLDIGLSCEQQVPRQMWGIHRWKRTSLI